MKQIIIFFMIAVIVVSCKKEPDFIGHGCNDSVQSGSREEQGAGEIDMNDSQQTTMYVTSTNPAGQSSSTTPIPGTWHISQSYLDNYQHFYQMDAKPDYPGSVLCGPTSYMLAAHMIVTAKGGVYPSSKTKLGAIYTKLSQANKFDDAEGMYIGDLCWFNSTYDHPVVKTTYKRTTSRSLMKEYIEYFIKTGYPVIATVNIYGMQGAYWENDLDGADQPNTKYYVSKDGPVGHFILLTGIKINADGSGRVWYKDPLSKLGETRCMSYTRLLDAMKYNGNNDYYDAVAVFD
jgi:hypothetical protein